MKVVHLIFALELGGSENMLVDIANEQAQLANVTIIIINKQYNTALLSKIEEKVQVHTLNRRPGNKLSMLFLIRLWILLLRIQPAVIHCHQQNLIRLLATFKKRAVLTVHCLGIPVAHLKKYKQVYAISQAVAYDIKQRAGIITPVILNGISFTQVATKSDYTIDSQMTVRIVQVGRLDHEIKGQDLLLYALHKLLSDEQYKNMTVDFIGAGSSQPYLEEIVDRLSLKTHVFFRGERSRSWIYQNLATYDLLVQPSRSEGFGLTILEGIAAGLPVIASDHAGPREILQDLPGNCLFKPGDVEALALSIKNMAGQVRANKVQSLCAMARTLADHQYSVRNTAHTYLRHYTTDI